MNKSPLTKSIQTTLQLEGLALFVASLILYQTLGGSWSLFLFLFFAPDICFLGYLAGPKAGALSYNLAHTETLPIILALSGLSLGYPLAILMGLIWLSHINFDRMIGCGLKMISGGTHLGTGPFKKDRSS